MKLLITCIALALLISPTAVAEPGNSDDDRPSAATSSDAGDVDERQAITTWLSHHHQIPDREQLENISEDARDIVFEIAGDEQASPFHRQRAMQAMANWPDDESFEFLVGVVKDDDTPETVRRHLLLTLAEGFDERALETIEPFLVDSSDSQTRISAANAIAQIPGERSQKLLEEALRAEQDPIVAERIEQFATRLR